jgi:hypothetical protein
VRRRADGRLLRGWSAPGEPSSTMTAQRRNDRSMQSTPAGFTALSSAAFCNRRFSTMRSQPTRSATWTHRGAEGSAGSVSPRADARGTAPRLRRPRPDGDPRRHARPDPLRPRLRPAHRRDLRRPLDGPRRRWHHRRQRVGYAPRAGRGSPPERLPGHQNVYPVKGKGLAIHDGKSAMALRVVPLPEFVVSRLRVASTRTTIRPGRCSPLPAATDSRPTAGPPTSAEASARSATTLASTG